VAQNSGELPFLYLLLIAPALGAPPATRPRRFYNSWLEALNSIPVEMVRATLLKQKLPKAFQPTWKFYDGGKP
jgi:hypothetical protein